MKRPLVLMTILFSMFLTAYGFQTPDEIPPIRNFTKINQDFCTAGQPRPEHFAKLKADGIKTVLNLRPAGEHRAAEEEEAVKQAGLRYINIPVVYGTPNEEQVAEFLKITDDASLRPMLIHCTAAIRASAFFMIRRVLRDGIPLEKAEEDAKKNGLVNAPHWTEFVHAYIAKHQATQGKGKEGGKKKMTKEITTLGGGCFWCVEAVFKELKGVDKVVSGYSGGHVTNPSYKQVTTGQTGHAEVIQVHFDPSVITYKELLEVFFTVHDPTTLNQQGADIGTQYRSAIFYHSPEQQATAQEVLKQIDEAKIWNRPIVTEITRFEKFYEAEDYHQNYFELNPEQGYCRVVIAPKVAKFRKMYLSKLKKAPAAH
jgi:peptide-methionine (S)-S-oxide reductase